MANTRKYKSFIQKDAAVWIRQERYDRKDTTGRIRQE